MRRLPVPLWFFELSPAVTVSVKGARKKEDKDKGTPAYAEVNLAAQGAVGIFLGGGVPKLAEVYGGAELSLELAVTYKSICDKHEECGFSLAGGLALKGALKAGVTLGAVDVSYKLGEAELIKIQLGHLCSEGLEGADFELGKDPKAVIDTINEVIDNAGEIVENLGGFLTGEDPLEAAKNFIKCNQAVQEEIGTRAKAEKEFFKSLGLSSPWVNNVAYVYAWRDALDDYKRDIEKSAVSRALLPRWRAVAAEFESLCYAISEGASGDFSGVMNYAHNEEKNARAESTKTLAELIEKENKTNTGHSREEMENLADLQYRALRLPVYTIADIYLDTRMCRAKQNCNKAYRTALEEYIKKGSARNRKKMPSKKGGKDTKAGKDNVFYELDREEF